MIGHAVLWIYAMVMYFDQEFRYGCESYMPHYFFVKCYALVNAAMLVAGAAMIFVLALPAIALTIKSFKKKNN